MSSGTDNIHIRPLRLEKVPEFLKLFRETVNSVPDYTPRLRKLFNHKYRSAVVKKRIKDGVAVCLAAFVDQKLAGFCWGPAVKRTDDGVYWMNWIGVGRAFRRRGIARMLMGNFEDRLRTKGYHKIWMNIDPKNARSAKTFRALGFRRAAVIKNHWYRQDATLWHKEISK